MWRRNFGMVVMIGGIFLLLGGQISLASDGYVVSESKIDSVTVYPDRAMLNRKAEVDLDTGDYRIGFEGLPAGIIEDSVRARAKGTGQIKITGLEIERVFLERVENKRIVELEDKIQELEDERRGLEDKRGVLNSERAFVESIQVKKADDASRTISEYKPEYKVNVDDWRGIVSFMSENLTRIKKETLSLEVAQRDIDRKLDALRRELNQLKSRAYPLETKKVVAKLSVSRKGSFEVEISYCIMGASWTPSYDVRVDSDTKEVELDYYGQVRQRTGEDWKDVEIILSTAKPAVGAEAPELTPWRLRFYEPVRMIWDEARKVGASKEEFAMPSAVYEEEKQKVTTEVPVARVEEAGTSVLFRVERKQAIPSDGEPHKTTVAIEKFPAKFKYYTVPKLSLFAYLKATITNSTDYPLLAGEVNVFMGPDYVGKSRIKNIAPTQELDLSLGIDERIKVKRELVKKEESLAGLLNKNKRLRYLYKITLENYKNTSETIVLRDQIPVSEHEDIVAKTLKISPEPLEPTEEEEIKKKEQGILKWEFTLEPKEKKEVVLDFSVEFPKDRTVPGLF